MRTLSWQQLPGRRRHLLFQRLKPAGEEVVGSLYPGELLGGGEALIHRFELRAGTVLIVRALYEDLGSSAVLQIVGRTPARREPGRHHEARALTFTSQARDHARAERKPRERVRQLRIAFTQP